MRIIFEIKRERERGIGKRTEHSTAYKPMKKIDSREEDGDEDEDGRWSMDRAAQLP